jgi:MOSC domain-containing protein YiiM
MMVLDSINVGQARPIPGMKALTGIFKEPVAGPVAVTRQGIAADVICDRRHHGGVDQAIYLYFTDDYAFWQRELGSTLAAGTFGENLTLSGAESAGLAVGDRMLIGDLVLEITYHRTPCMTLAARMGDRGFVKRFHHAGRPGAYCRVIEPASIEAGMDVSLLPFAGERVTMGELMALDGVRDLDPAFMQRALTTPIRDKTRFKYEDLLARLF